MSIAAVIVIVIALGFVTGRITYRRCWSSGWARVRTSIGAGLLVGGALGAIVSLLDCLLPGGGYLSVISRWALGISGIVAFTVGLFITGEHSGDDDDSDGGGVPGIYYAASHIGR